jgi:hypothetical protein
MPTQEVHVARKEYRCDAPLAPCARRILRGAPYTQVSYKPGEAPFNASTWQVLRCCSSCIPIEGETRAPVQCGAGNADAQCPLPSGHYPRTPHEIPQGLF